MLGRYRKPSHARSIIEIAITFGPLLALWALAWTALYLDYWIMNSRTRKPAAGIASSTHSHHGRNRAYDFWRRTHAMHHASSGHLERRGLGDVDTLTVREYLALSFWGCLRYRVYRHPGVMFGIGPAYLFILKHRLPVGLLRNGWQPWLSTMATNLAIRGDRRRPDPAHRHRTVPVRAPPNYASRGLGRSMAVLRAGRFSGRTGRKCGKCAPLAEGSLTKSSFGIPFSRHLANALFWRGAWGRSAGFNMTRVHSSPASHLLARCLCPVVADVPTPTQD